MNYDKLNAHISKEDNACGKGSCSNGCGDQFIVGWHEKTKSWLCLGCMDEHDQEEDFKPCTNCDGHPACEDFGCALEQGVPINRTYF